MNILRLWLYHDGINSEARSKGGSKPRVSMDF